jgi:hypothetical protein
MIGRKLGSVIFFTSRLFWILFSHFLLFEGKQGKIEKAIGRKQNQH